MTDFDWNATCERPLSIETVWALMQAGCNENEIAAAGGISVRVALGLMTAALPRPPRREVLHLATAA